MGGGRRVKMGCLGAPEREGEEEEGEEKEGEEAHGTLGEVKKVKRKQKSEKKVTSGGRVGAAGVWRGVLRNLRQTS